MHRNICIDGIWNSSAFMGVNRPEFTSCFQYSVLLIPSSMFILSFILLVISKSYKHCAKIYQLPFDFLYCLKLIVPVMLIGLFLTELKLDLLLMQVAFDGLYIVSFSAMCVALICVIVWTEIKRRTMNPICPWLFAFWLLSLCGYCVRFYSNMCRFLPHYNNIADIVFIGMSASVVFLLFVGFLLDCWNRYNSDRSKLTRKIPSPEEYAPIISRLTYTWLDSYIYKWFKTEMTDDNVFDLRHGDETERNISRLEKLFHLNLRNRKSFERSVANTHLSESSENLVARGHDNGKSYEYRNPTLTLFVSIGKIYFSALLGTWMLKSCQDLLLFTDPFLLKLLLSYIQTGNSVHWQGYGLAALFLLIGTVRTLMDNYGQFIETRISFRVHGALVGMIYRKALRLNSEARNKYTTGEVVNLMSVDAERVVGWISYSWFLLSCTLQITLAIGFLYTELSYAIFAGVGVIVIFIPLNAAMMTLSQKFSELELTWKDKRIKLLTEILKGIKVLKMYAWELSFASKLNKIRHREVGYIRNDAIVWGVISVIWDLIPFFVMFSTFLVYVYTANARIINAEKAFVSLALFNLIRYPMTLLPWSITDSINAFVSLRRISKFLIEDELNPNGICHLNDNGEKSTNDVVIEIVDGCFSWKKDDKLILKNINLQVTRNKLIAVVGKVGTGKSSLLSAILGEMERKNGTVKVQGNFAFVSQEAWIQNMSLKKNVLFTKAFDEKLYTEIINACALSTDLSQLTKGDETEIGERGINLSGGQKQRVSLARALYQDCDIYLLDDPLSAVDAHVGKHLFDHVISNNGLLRNKTRILVTHGVHWLPMVDEIFVIDCEGTISERGSYEELLHDGKEFTRFIQDYKKSVTDHYNDRGKTKSIPNCHSKEDVVGNSFSTSPKLTFSGSAEMGRSPKFSINALLDKTNDDVYLDEEMVETQKLNLSTSGSDYVATSSDGISEADETKSPLLDNGGQLVDEEQAMIGTVKWKTYLMYLKSFHPAICFFTFLAYVVFVCFKVLSNMWLERFTADPILQNASDEILANVSSSTAKDEIRQRTNYYMGYYLLIGVMEIVFLSLYCIGYISGIVRASKIIFDNLLKTILRAPMMFFDTTPSGRIINRFSKDMESIDHVVPFSVTDCVTCLTSVLSSFIVIIIVTPWFSLMIIPLTVIYYLIQKFYIPSSRQARRLESISSSPIFSQFSETLQGVAVIRAFKEQLHFQEINQTLVDRKNKYYSIRFFTNRWLTLRLDVLGNITVFAAVLFVIIDKNNLTPSLVGLSISYALQISGYLNWLVIQLTKLETNTVAVERVREYSMVQSEANWQTEKNLSDNWPTSGNIAFTNFDICYRPELPLVLKSITFVINGGEKIGIVGRTGAGKSSLNQALFRLVEGVGGSIVIDGIDTGAIGLHDLRSRLTILPQDPVLFSGTIRENLDPFEKYTDVELLECLDKAHLKVWVAGLSEGLGYECGEGGANLSVGQKQLLCLGRALLRKSKVLILDEATASVDVETDRLVMETIKDYFRGSLVIIIAHRINTILDCDRIMVIDDGRVKEFDKPNVLLDRPNSLFKALADQSGKNELHQKSEI